MLVPHHLETPMLSTLLEKTDPARRRIGTAIVVGIIGGFLSAIVKFGWEVPFPPRTPERNATNPPQQLLEQLGMSPEQSHTGVTFNGNEGLPIYSFIIHFSFAIVFAVFYCVMAEYYKSITLWQGAAFGLLVWVGAHLVLMPLTGTVPSPFPWVAGGQTWAEHFSEALGRGVWVGAAGADVALAASLSSRIDSVRSCASRSILCTKTLKTWPRCSMWRSTLSGLLVCTWHL